MMIEILDRLHDSGELRELVHSGLISPNAIFWRRIYHSYKKQIEDGVKPFQAVNDISDIFGISNRSVYRILKILKSK